MQVNYEKMTKRHPEFTHYLFDENDCYNFINDNFDKSVLDAYNALVPSAYKSDLWRYCVLYINGGIYFDIKFYCVNDFKLTALTEKEYFVRDLEESGSGTLNGLMSVKPKNGILLKCIRQIVENVKNQFYGNNALDPTGPGLLGSFFDLNYINNLELYFTNTNVENVMNQDYIVYNNNIILKYYLNYRVEQSQTQKLEHYSALWDKRQIYK
jgi:mannosyltransferase OCH1-like enzyme